MEIIRLAGLLSVLTLTACQGAGLPNSVAAKNDVPTEWKFNFFTPQALPALVTFAAVQDADGAMYQFNTLDSTKALYGVIGGWDDNSRALNGYSGDPLLRCHAERILCVAFFVTFNQCLFHVLLNRSLHELKWGVDCTIRNHSVLVCTLYCT